MIHTVNGNVAIHTGFEELKRLNKFVYAVATMDTKGVELRYVAECLRAAGVHVRMVDVGTGGPPATEPDVTGDEVRGSDGKVSYESRAAAVTAMGESLKAYLVNKSDAGQVAGVIGIGGSGGTALITPAMRTLAIGLPKVMVSTVASGNTAPYVDCSDITMMYSVVDVAGLNVVSRQVLGNAAHAMAGMVQNSVVAAASKVTLGLTMFGVTTKCVDVVREKLEQAGHQCLVFHATGTGGRAMEQLVESRMLKGVLDITTTEVADEVVGGIFPAGNNRFERLTQSGVPVLLSLGALDMVNFGEQETVPARFSGRLFHVHNAQVTLMRTNAEENFLMARWIASRIRHATSPMVVMIPELGLSALDAPGQPFHDPETNAILFQELEEQLKDCAACRVIRIRRHINDREFAEAVVDHFTKLAIH
ncbi:Tm-1-like ATP-binding domain-containing protein [bacterium]|nr:Tm-1-like ATP-binding domain-containing protein [bacterium]